ncbi:MAG TPA: hypothetical protein VMT24_18190 [Aggregatilineaceae bacterium]|jgi:hypothetical protein|nr:hypothetical protein [Aggregatilineaceae bacterium]
MTRFAAIVFAMLCALGLAISGAGAQAGGDERIKNGDFGQGLEFWAVDQPCSSCSLDVPTSDAGRPVCRAEVHSLWPWDGQWVLESAGDVIVGGQSLAQQLGVQEIFGWPPRSNEDCRTWLSEFIRHEETGVPTGAR